NPTADEHALKGAKLIGDWLPHVVARPQDLGARKKLLKGAMHAGMALGGSMHALTLPPALRFNAGVAPDALRRFGEALGTDDPAARVEELARLGGFRELRDFAIPEDELAVVASA